MPTRGRHLRPADEIQRDLAGARAGRAAGIESAYYDGAIAAYEWILGAVHATPMTGDLATPTITNVIAEENAADLVLTGAMNAPPGSPRYANGVQHALMWARTATDDSPGELFQTA